MTELPGWTCPAFDRLATLVRTHVPDGDRTEALLLIEELRVSHVRLRVVASGSNPKKAEKEIARLEERIETIREGKDSE